MNRRGFVAGLGSLAMAPALPAQESRRHAGRMKITEVRNVRLKLVRELGTLEPAWTPGSTLNFRVVAEGSSRYGLTRAWWVLARPSTQFWCPWCKRP